MITVQAAFEMGFRIGSFTARGRRAWYLRTPFSGRLVCPSYAVAWRTLLGVLT